MRKDDMTSSPPNPRVVNRSTTVIEVGGGHVTAATVAVSSSDFSIAQRHDLPLDSSGRREAILETLTRAAQGARRDSTADCVVALPGPFDYTRGSGGFEGIGKFEALAGLDLRRAIADRLDIAPAAVSFVNDAVAYGIGEWAFGAGMRADRMLCLTLGTGVGSVFLNAGSPVTHGDDVPLDGEAHTIRYRGAPLEHSVSTAAIVRAYVDARRPATTVLEVFEQARAGDEAARAVVTSAIDSLGQALGPWIARFGATTTVIGGGMSKSWDLIEAPLRTALEASGAVSSLRPATLLDQAPLVGAALWADRLSALSRGRRP